MTSNRIFESHRFVCTQAIFQYFQNDIRSNFSCASFIAFPFSVLLTNVLGEVRLLHETGRFFTSSKSSSSLSDSSSLLRASSTNQRICDSSMSRYLPEGSMHLLPKTSFCSSTATEEIRV